MSKEFGPKGPGFGLPQRKRLKAQGTGHRAKTITENLLTPYALRLVPQTSFANKAIELWFGPKRPGFRC